MTHVCYQFPAIHLEGMFGVAVVVEAGGHIIERTGNLSQLVITGSIDPSCIIFPCEVVRSGAELLQRRDDRASIDEVGQGKGGKYTRNRKQ